MTNRILKTALLLGSLLASAPVLAAQTPADSAAILRDAARRLEESGDRDAADALRRQIEQRFPPRAADATGVAPADPRMEPLAAAGRFRFVGWGAIYGSWLGVAVPASFGASGARTYGVGLLVGGPLGLVGAMQYARQAQPTRGQADAMVFGSQWGTWQGIGWKSALDIGGPHQRQVCPGGGSSCYYEEDRRDVFQAMVVGGLAGLGTGLLAGRALNPTEGQMSMVGQSALWGTWFGLAGGIMADQHDDALLATTLVAGNAGLLLGALAAPRDVTPGRVWLTTAVGIAGGAMGLGVDLIVQSERTSVNMFFPAALSAAGLAWGWHLTAPIDARRRAQRGGGDGGASALIERCADCGTNGSATWRVGLAAPMPSTMTLAEDRLGRRIERPAVRLGILHAQF